MHKVTKIKIHIRLWAFFTVIPSTICAIWAEKLAIACIRGCITGGWPVTTSSINVLWDKFIWHAVWVFNFGSPPQGGYPYILVSTNLKGLKISQKYCNSCHKSLHVIYWLKIYSVFENWCCITKQDIGIVECINSSASVLTPENTIFWLQLLLVLAVSYLQSSQYLDLFFFYCSLAKPDNFSLV